MRLSSLSSGPGAPHVLDNQDLTHSERCSELQDPAEPRTIGSRGMGAGDEGEGGGRGKAFREGRMLDSQHPEGRHRLLFIFVSPGPSTVPGMSRDTWKYPWCPS